MTQPTSAAAYAWMKDTRQIGPLQRRISEALLEKTDLTSNELAELLEERINTISPRLSELRDRGAVHNLYKRPCSVTGIETIAWCLTGDAPEPRKQRNRASTKRLRKGLADLVEQIEKGTFRDEVGHDAKMLLAYLNGRALLEEGV